MVRGVSMEPTLSAGDRLLVQYDVPARPGHVVLVHLPGGTVAVKRVTARSTGVLTAESDNGVAPGAWSGIVPEQDVLGVVRLRMWPRPGRLPRR